MESIEVNFESYQTVAISSLRNPNTLFFSDQDYFNDMKINFYTRLFRNLESFFIVATLYAELVIKDE